MSNRTSSKYSIAEFGPAVEPDGVRFRLWAPGAETVEVALSERGADRFTAMQARDGGWFEVFVPQAGDGALYRFRINGETLVPDPASLFQPEDVFGPSQVVDTAAFEWKTATWTGRPWTETVLYELHVGTFTPEGTYDGVCSRLGQLKDLGVTAIELMPLADFPGKHNWGYDGVLPFAPDSAYGTPEDLKRLIDEAHGLGLMVFLDVVYNHFGPEGNFLHLYAPQFFTPAHQTPWGAAIDFSVRQVRDFFIANAVYWLAEYRFDGLRLDAVHAIWDDSEVHILEELADAVHAALPAERRVHLVLENDANQACFLAREHKGNPRFYVAQWNDDIHHVFHVLATGESRGYYADYAEDALNLLGRCLARGFAYQGEASVHRGGEARGEPSAHLPPEAFVAFLQNHDQIGNRALGERLSVLARPEAREALATVLLLSPQVPMLYMGEEWGTCRPFPFFCDFHGDLADAVREGRRKEFAAFPEFADPAMRERIPDPNDPATARSAVLDWSETDLPEHARWLDLHRRLLSLRQKRILPLLALIRPGEAVWAIQKENILTVQWPLSDGRMLMLTANLGPETVRIASKAGIEAGQDWMIFASKGVQISQNELCMPSWSVCWSVCQSEGAVGAVAE